MRKRFFLRLTILALALILGGALFSALADEAPVLYEATATSAVKIYPNADGNAKALTTIPKDAALYVTSRSVVNGNVAYYTVLYKNTRGFAATSAIELNLESVRENDESLYVPVAFGDERTEVAAVQEALKELGFYTGKADGAFGAVTRQAVTAYQKANGLKQTGAADAATQRALFGGASKNNKGKLTGITTAPASLNVTLKSGHTGPAVRALQTKLKELGYYKKTVDGQYGSGTVSAVKAFQKAKGLSQTGTADSQTQRLLYGYENATVNAAIASPTPAVTATPTAAPTVSNAKTFPFTTYTLAAVNLRKYASTSSTRLLTVPRGAEISVASVGSAFVKATYKGTTGYLAIEFVYLPDQYLPGKTLKATEDTVKKYAYLPSNVYSKATVVFQEALKELGFYTGNSDGYFGANTVSALKAFQKQNDLKQDGIASPEIQEFVLEGRPLNSKGKRTAVKILPLIDNIDLVAGDRGEQVTNLQHQLITLGFYTGQPTGTFDSATEKAVKAFQQAHNLYVDGKVGAKTRQLLGLLAVTPTPAPKLTPTPTPAAKAQGTATPTPAATPLTLDNVVVMRKGVKGDAVKQLQRRLIELGYYTCVVDGVYDADEIEAVKAFQRKNSLDVDGVAGLQTQLTLYSARAIPLYGEPEEAPLGLITPAPTPYTITVPPSSTLRIGHSGDAVKALQQRLAALGYYKGKIDGSFGTGTAQAVTAFQTANKLTADGVAGEKTMSRLNSASAVAATTPKPAATATPTPTPKVTVLRSGDKGEQVKAMQKRLVTLGYLKAADGVFGVQTYNAVTAFQKRNGLKADGVAGEMTLARLNSTAAVAAANTATATPAPASQKTSAAFKAPSASEVRNANWYSEIRARAKAMPDVIIYDPDTGLHFNLHMFSFGKHADSEPPTAADTAVLNQICGVNSWTPHYVWVIFSDGRVYIGSIHSHGHEVDHTSGNNLEGHICLHFPRVMSEAEATGPYAVSHQKEILFGWEITQAMRR